MLQTSPKSNYNYGYINEKNKHLSKKSNNSPQQDSNLAISTVVLFLIILAIIMSLVVAYIYQFVQITHLNYEINGLDQRIEEIGSENNSLSLRLAKERSIVKVETIAREKLGMVEPENVRVVVLNNQEESIDKNTMPDNEPVFFAKLFTNIRDIFATVKAEEIK